MTNSSTAKITAIKPGTQIRVCKSDRGNLTLPVKGYERFLNATATVQEIRENHDAIIPCVEIVTDLGVCRGNWKSVLHLATS